MQKGQVLDSRGRNAKTGELHVQTQELVGTAGWMKGANWPDGRDGQSRRAKPVVAPRGDDIHVPLRAVLCVCVHAHQFNEVSVQSAYAHIGCGDFMHAA